MFTLRVSAEVPEDRRIELTVPEEVPTGRAEFVVTLAGSEKQPSRPGRISLAEWADEQAEDWGDQLNSTDVPVFTGRGA